LTVLLDSRIVFKINISKFKTVNRFNVRENAAEIGIIPANHNHPGVQAAAANLARAGCMVAHAESDRGKK
jgi:hypothetical protein